MQHALLAGFLADRTIGFVGRSRGMARKAYRRKGRTCSLCKPRKRGITPRWTDKDLQRLRAFEKAKSLGDWSPL